MSKPIDGMLHLRSMAGNPRAALPPWLESHRPRIEQMLPALERPAVTGGEGGADV